MNILEYVSSLFESSAPLTKIITVTIPALTFLIPIFIFLLKNLVLDSFDIKLLHKSNHTAINIAKSLTSITLIALFFFGVEWYLLFVIKQFSVLEIILLIVVVVYFGLFTLSLIVFSVCNFLMKRKLKNENDENQPEVKGIFKIITNNSKTIFIVSLTLLLLLFGTLILVVLDDTGERTQNLIGTSFLFSFLPSIIIFLYKPLRKQRYELSEILTDPIEIAKRKLNLEYAIDNNTSVLSRKSENEDIVAIKREYEGNYSVEIYKVIEIYQPTSQKTVTPSPAD